ncbi:hypothetical protein HELRODRAFT_165352 [Helobdella robusta]|uniref:DUF4371 domain-containing protein n=1 Tax=Helobdella robusta TaxID=6412 RepID=T1EWM4_HELRO|nr:hypothetical protein HELRODRAFT_165352 [Helobdella robusta]ESN91332.1 hypothetical protein HELRODRAFT_165352 [Helobdella robusta]
MSATTAQNDIAKSCSHYPKKQRKIGSFFNHSIVTTVPNQNEQFDPEDIFYGTTLPDHSSSVTNSISAAKSKVPVQAECVSQVTHTSLPFDQIISKDFAPFRQWYKGFKLDAAWLQRHHSELKAIKLGSRKGLKCKLCYDNISEAKKYARNGTVPIADGVRCDGMQQLQRIIDHLKGGAHSAAQRADLARKQWTAQSDKHPWVKILKQHNIELISTLIRLTVDVHNDSVTKTLSAWSWPSRSLAQMHAKNQVKQYIDHGLDCDFVAFNPPQSALHYRNPDRYREILSFASKHELSRVIQALKIADCVALKIDKSVDKYNADSLFVTARYMDNTNFEMKASFLGECHSELRGVIGMVDALQKRFQYLEIEDVIKAKMVGLTTDEENSNTGRHGGLWVKMSEYLGHNMLTFWCIAHRSVLAFESVENVVPKFRHWLTDVKNVATYFRGQATDKKTCMKLLQIWVRLLNIFHDIMKKTVVQQGENNEKNNEKQRARGFLKDWSQTSFNLNMSAVALDILRQFTDLQKEAQCTFVTLADLMQKRDHVLQQFVDDAVGYYSSFGASSFKPHESNTAKLYLLLQKTTLSSLLNKLVQTFLITCPHSMITERLMQYLLGSRDLKRIGTIIIISKTFKTLSPSENFLDEALINPDIWPRYTFLREWDFSYTKKSYDNNTKRKSILNHGFVK